jgi:hypothetical protein
MSGGRLKRADIKQAVPWILLGVFLLAPLYTITTAFAIRSGVFNLSDTTITKEETQALWAFVASGLATAATLIGLLITRSHNQRTLAFQKEVEDRKLLAQEETDKRLALDTVVRGLELVGASSGEYAPKATIAGALGALVHLGHPVIAMRTLGAAWGEDAVDPASASWLISEVVRTGTEASKNEAVGLLREHAKRLTKDEPAVYEWPDALWMTWRKDLAINSRYAVLLAVFELLYSKDKAWWGSNYHWMIATLENAWRLDEDDYLRAFAAALLKLLLEGFPRDVGFSTGDRKLYISEIRSELEQYNPEFDMSMDDDVIEITHKYRLWTAGQPTK